MSRKNSKAKTNHQLPEEGRGPLTTRETQVTALIARDLDNNAIAKTLSISVETVKEHVQNSLRKTKFRSRVGLAVWFVTPGKQASAA